jgi:hypothetical protein
MHRFLAHTTPSPPSNTNHQTLTSEELAFLKKHEAAGKISLHQEPFITNQFQTKTSSLGTLTFTIPQPNHNIEPGFVYTDTIPTQPNNIPFIHNSHTHQQPNTIPFDTSRPHSNRHNQTNFNLSIARPKLDFPAFFSEEPFNWLRQCEKYFTLANVPMES